MGCGIEVPAQRVLAGGLIVYVEKESFLRLLGLKKNPLVVMGELSSSGFGIRKVKAYIMPFEGALMVYRGEGIELQKECIVIKSSEINISVK